MPLTMLCHIVLLSHLALVPAVSRTLEANDDWPQWRGRQRDGLSRDSNLLDQWPAGGPELVWKASGLGNGYSTVSVARGRIYTQGARGSREYVIALEAIMGREVWATPHGRRYRNSRGDGPRGAPTVDGNRVYALSGSGDLSCLEADTGKIVWSVNVLETFRGRNINWGISESPLVLEDRVLVNAGARNASIVALDKRDGSLLWKTASDEAGYSSAVRANINGVDQAVFFTGQRGVGVRISDGQVLWSYQRVSNRTANVATPVVRGNYVFLSSDYGTGCALLEISGGAEQITAREVYFTRDMRNHHSSSVLVGDTLYGFSSSRLHALNFWTGELAWRDRSIGKGSLVFADGHLYIFSENGVVGLVEATPVGYREKGRFEIRTSNKPTWAHPVVANGTLYLRDQDTLYAYAIRK